MEYGKIIRQLILDELSLVHPEDAVPAQSLLTKVRTEMNRRREEGWLQLHEGKGENLVLAEWHDLVRGGWVAPGEETFETLQQRGYHITERGHQMIETGQRDPTNPEGYMAHSIEPVEVPKDTRSYIHEAARTFEGGFYRAAAVLAGVAAESLINKLRDILIPKVKDSGTREKLANWQPSSALKGIREALDKVSGRMDKKLKGDYESYWPGITRLIRTTRNDAGHPGKDDVDFQDGVHRGLLLFPCFARTMDELGAFAKKLTDSSI